jgi:hypothetical protein
MDGWFHRTVFAIHEAERQTVLRYAETFLYLAIPGVEKAEYPRFHS